MATVLKALPGKIQMINEEGKFLYSEAQRFVDELKKPSSASSPYTVISIIGPQSSGKSYLLNALFETNFDVLNAAKGRRQTTKGIWIAKCRDPCMIIMDVEGSDGRERGEDDTLFEKQSALFSLVLSDVLLLNMWFHDIGRVQGGSTGLIKLIFQERVKIEAPKTTIMIVLRDYRYETPTDIISKQLEDYMNELWDEVHPPATDKKMGAYIKLFFRDIPCYDKSQDFAQKSKGLANYLCSIAASGSTQEQKYCVSSFAYSSQKMWDDICNNKRLINAANLKLAESHYVCYQIKEEILYSLDQEAGYGYLMSGTSLSVKKFNTELSLFLQRTLARYEEEATAFDGNIMEKVRIMLEEETLQVFKQTFKDKIVRLYYEKLSLAKPKVLGQLLELAVRDHSSVVGVTRPYLTEFGDNLPADVHPYFQKIVNKRRNEFGVHLTKFAEEEAKKIAEEEAKKSKKEHNIKRGLKVAVKIAGSIILQTAIFLVTGDVTGVVDVLKDILDAASSSNT